MIAMSLWTTPRPPPTLPSPPLPHRPATFHRRAKAVFTGAKYLKYIISGVICAIGGPPTRALACEMVGGREKMGYRGKEWRGVEGYEAVRASWTKACIHRRGPEQTWPSASSKGHLCLSSKSQGPQVGAERRDITG